MPDKPNQPETGAPKAVGDPGLQEVEVEEDWVWDNFDKPTIQTAQQVALRHADTFDVIYADDDGTEKACTLDNGVLINPIHSSKSILVCIMASCSRAAAGGIVMLDNRTRCKI